MKASKIIIFKYETVTRHLKRKKEEKKKSKQCVPESIIPEGRHQDVPERERRYWEDAKPDS